MTKQKKISPENKNILQEFHHLLETENFTMLKKFFSLKNLQNNINQKGYLSLVIKYLILTNDFKNIKIIVEKYSNHLNKRDLLQLCNFYYHNQQLNRKYLEKSNIFFNQLISKYEVNDENLIFLIENNLSYFIKKLEGYFCPIKVIPKILSKLQTFKIKPSNSPFIYPNLKMYHFNPTIIQTNLEIISKNTTKISEMILYFKNYLDIEKINDIENISNLFIIIDGGNVLFSNKAKINNISFERLILLMIKIKQLNKIPILIIHKRHFDKKRYLDTTIHHYIDYLTSNFLYFKTPFHENDDYYILYLGLKYKIKIVTNDLFGDHISILKSRSDGLQTLYQTEFYIKDLQIKYIFKESPKNISFPDQRLTKFIDLETIQEYSKCIQVINDHACICDKNGKYYYIQ